MVRANFDRAKNDYPSWQADEATWSAFFETAEGFRSFGRLLGDIYQRAKIEEDRENGVHRLGRKPRLAVSLDEVMATIFPDQFSTDPFPVAFEALLNGRSQRQFASRCGMPQSSLSRILNGATKLDMPLMEQIARGGKVPASYFVEWRAMYVGTLFTDILNNYPHLGVHAVKMLRSFHT